MSYNNNRIEDTKNMETLFHNTNTREDIVLRNIEVSMTIDFRQKKIESSTEQRYRQAKTLTQLLRNVLSRLIA